MIERQLQKQVARSLVDGQVIVLHGLPQVGRTELVRCIAKDGAHARIFTSSKQFLSQVNDLDMWLAELEEELVVVDHVALEHVNEIVSVFRELDSRQSRPCFLLAPQDCIASGALLSAYRANTFEVPPLQLQEYLRGLSTHDLPMSPAVDDLHQSTSQADALGIEIRQKRRNQRELRVRQVTCVTQPPPVMIGASERGPGHREPLLVRQQTVNHRRPFRSTGSSRTASYGNIASTSS